MQYVTKYSAAFWGTSFVREMTKLNAAAQEDGAPSAQKDGQAELQLKREDMRGSSVVDGSVPLTPPVNAPAAANSV